MNVGVVRPGMEFLSGGGEMGGRIRAFDWSRTPLDRPEKWPQSLKTAVGIMLNSGYPMYIAWGSSSIQLYNDAYRPILGDSKHPSALGISTADTFAEIWNQIGPMFGSVLKEATPSTFTDLMMPLNRYGFPEECFFVFSYSPVLLSSGSVGGVFVTVLETTDRVLRERRQRVVKDIAAIHVQGSREEIFGNALNAIASSPGDAPFSAICRQDEHGVWSVIGCNGPSHLSNDAIIVALETAQRVGAASTPFTLSDSVVCDPWPEPVARFTCRPILPPGSAETVGVLVFGVSPRLRWDDEYSAFYDSCASSLATVVANAEALTVERKRSEALAEIDRAKTVFFCNVSHEFRTPLTLMLGPLEDAMVEASRNGTNDSHFVQIETVHRNALRLKRLVSSLLDFSRIEAGRASALFQPTDLVPLTTYLVSSFRSATEKAGIELVIDASEPDGNVYLDRDMWENIILNLVSNAFKFTLEGSIRVEIGTRADGRSATVTVRDTGVGVPERELPRLFERFHRVEGVIGRSIEGSGIGLALVKELVGLHGGSLAVESEVGKGTAFTITLPIGKDHLPPDQVSSISESTRMGQRPGGFVAEALRWLPPGETGEKLTLLANDTPRNMVEMIDRRVLVVDDNADMRDYLRHLLQGHGYHVETALDGLAALDIIASNPPDLVLCDLMMPRLDGLDLLARLRADETTRELPFIALSARAGEEARIEGLNASADSFLVKPFSSRELFARVGSTIEVARVRRKAREALKDEYTRLRRLFEQAPGFIATVRGPNHVFEFANAAYRRLVGDRDIIGKSVDEALPEIRDQGFIDLLDEVYRTGKPYLAENMPARIKQDENASSKEVILNFVYEAITDADGAIVGVFVVGHDITPQHQANQHLQLLVNELNHRVKNMLTIVQSLNRHTFKGTRSPDKEREAFEGRLLALASAHDLLTRANWETTTLADVAREVFEIHSNENAFTISGPTVRLNPKTAVTLAMAFHELSTNAIKYGALSIPGGSVALSWRIEPEPKRRLLLLWCERGGPNVEKPDRRGFGSLLIERGLANELGGDAILDFRSDGLVCQIIAPFPEGAST